MCPRTYIKDYKKWTCGAQKYPAEWYRDWWSAKENYRLQEKGGVFALILIETEKIRIDKVLQKKSYQRERLVTLYHDNCHRDQDYDAPTVTHIDFRQQMHRYVLLAEAFYESWGFVSSARSLQELSKLIEERYTEKFADEYYFVKFCVVDLTTLVLDFTIPKDAEEKYFDALPKMKRWTRNAESKEELLEFCTLLEGAQL